MEMMKTAVLHQKWKSQTLKVSCMKFHLKSRTHLESKEIGFDIACQY